MMDECIKRQADGSQGCRGELMRERLVSIWPMLGGKRVEQERKIRRSTINDLSRMLEIYEFARKQMRLTGNPNQWINYPSKELLEEDIKNGVSYVIESDSKVIGTFVFCIGEDPTYQVIEEGSWLNDEPYGTIHRIASDGTQKGLFELVEKYCSMQIDNIRIDTHMDNQIMQHILEKSGFSKCGIIYTYDGSPRIAYQKRIKRISETTDD